MNIGTSACQDNTQTSETNEVQRSLYMRLLGKSAQAAGIQALANQAINDGDHLNVLEIIHALARELVAGLNSEACLVGELDFPSL